jgi:hypothetical protein
MRFFCRGQSMAPAHQHRVKRRHDAGDQSQPPGEQRQAADDLAHPVASTTSLGSGTKSGTMGRNLSGAMR